MDWKSTINNDEFVIKKINFKTFDRIVNQNIIDTKNKYYHDIFLTQKNDMKKTWMTINETLNRNKNHTNFPAQFSINGRDVTHPQDIADHFNIFFSNIGTNLSANIDINDETIAFSDYLDTPTGQCFNFNEITEDETMSIINQLKNKNSSGIDEISNKLLKAIKHEVYKPLTLIINQTLSTGIFPEGLKIAKVKPLYKKGDKTNLNNYRPISLLPTISKVFERVIYLQLYNYLNINALLCEQQYGFRPQHSTELATIQLVDNIIENMDDKKNIKTPVAIFLDLSKAFDTINFNILLDKLQYYGVSNNSLTLIKSYLTNRFQYVQYNSSESNLLEMKTGIPQGSILGPLFFSIYINDIVKTSKKLSFLLYADDTSIYFNLEDFPSVDRQMAINNELEKINIWLQLNKLTLNTEKTKCMQFRKRRKVTPINITLSNKAIEVVPQFRFLGIILDDNLSWENHTNMVTNKLSKIIGVLHRLKYIYPKHILLILYNSLFVPHINFGSLVWGTTIKRLSKLQKKAIRIITHSNYLAHTEPLLKELHFLKAEDMFSLNVLKFLHKLSHNTLPPYFNIYRPHLEKIVTPYYLRSHPLPVPTVAHVFAESCLVFQLVKMKNNIKQNDELILRKLDEKSHSYYGFSKYVSTTIIHKYNSTCNKIICHTCGRI